MSFVQKSFHEVSADCYAWSMHSYDAKKEIQCNLGGIDLVIIFTRMVCSNYGEVKIPNRINVSSADPVIVKLFEQNLWQPHTYPNWNRRLWVFKNDPNISLPHLQYELRFFPNEELLKAQLTDEHSNSCVIV